MKPIQYIISETYQNLFKKNPISVVQLPLSASDRKYFRITNPDNTTIIATHSENIRENDSFIYLSNHFQKYNINVPTVIQANQTKNIYFQDDLGDVSLFSKIMNHNSQNEAKFDEILHFYKLSLEQLVKTQIDSSKDLDFTNCYPVAEFNRTSIMWDLNYFKYYFLKVSNIDFEEDLLEKEFDKLVDFLLLKEPKYFMFRDFQSRNIMIKDSKTYLIDYQGGRKGYLSYDIASCVLDAKANLSFELRKEIIDYYFELLKQKIKISREEFDNELSVSFLIRIMQAFGAYGYRGLIQKKQLFVQSIPLAARNLQYLLNTQKFNFNIEYLLAILDQLASKYSIKKTENLTDKLTVKITSFSYKKGLPEDTTDNGGGFIFDCRFLPNPGRIPEMQTKTAFDNEVKSMLENSQEVSEFVDKSYGILKPAIENYINRGFKNLMLSFGCTGGQHRSVFCANEISNKIKKEFDVNLILTHRELAE